MVPFKVLEHDVGAAGSAVLSFVRNVEQDVTSVPKSLFSEVGKTARTVADDGASISRKPDHER